MSGDGKILWRNHPAEKIELKKSLVSEGEDEDGRYVQIGQVGADAKERLRGSAWQPRRSHHFLITFSANQTYGYCLPASALSTRYWTGQQMFRIPAGEIAEFRFTMAGPDWFADLHQRIIRLHAQSVRPEHDIPDSAIAANYGAAAELDTETADVPTANELGSCLAGYPWWKIERWNRRAAHTGYGVYLPLSCEARITNVVWMGYRWSVEDKVQYFATQKLPVRFHQGDVPPNCPIMLIRAISVRTCKAHWVTDFPTRVNGWRLDPGPFPCLYYVDCGSYAMRGVERSGLFFPSEYINHELLNKGYSEHLGRKVTSGREFVRKYGDYSNSNEYIAYLTNLERCLRAPKAGFHVREGKEFDDATVSFYNAHINKEKLLTWFSYGKICAKENYLVLSRDLWQKLADEWVTDGIVKNPMRGINQPVDGEDDEPGILDILSSSDPEEDGGLQNPGSSIGQVEDGGDEDGEVKGGDIEDGRVEDGEVGDGDVEDGEFGDEFEDGE